MVIKQFDKTCVYTIKRFAVHIQCFVHIHNMLMFVAAKHLSLHLNNNCVYVALLLFVIIITSSQIAFLIGFRSSGIEPWPLSALVWIYRNIYRLLILSFITRTLSISSIFGHFHYFRSKCQSPSKLFLNHLPVIHNAYDRHWAPQI